ncbi:hypothetical protein MASR2M66_15010 [Chloroflexota bacterium]
MTDPKRPLKVFLCHAHADRDPVRGLYARLTNDGVDIIPEGCAWLDKAKPCGEPVEPSSQDRIGSWRFARLCYHKQ